MSGSTKRILGWLAAILIGGGIVSAALHSSKPETSPAYYSQQQRGVAENGSYYGQISENTGRPKTVRVNGYYRKDGTYVREHYRSAPRGRGGRR